MSLKVYSRLSLAGLVVSGLCAAGPAPHAGHNTPLNSVSNRVYPSGASITQKYERPDASSAALTEASAAPGHVSAAAAMHNLMSQSKTVARVQKELAPVLRSQTRVQLGMGAGGEAVAPSTLAAAPALYRFTYGYNYKGVPLWTYSSQSQMVHVKNGVRKTVLLRERNAPNVDRLAGSDLNVNQEEAARARDAGLNDSKGATNAALAVDEKNEAPHREIHVDAQGNPTLAWAYVVRSNDRARPFARRYWVAAKGEPKVLAKEDLIYHAQDASAATAVAQGRVTGNIVGFKQSPLDPPALNQPLDDYLAEVGVVTDANGFFSVVTGRPFNTKLVGPFCTIVNEAGPAITAQKTGNNLSFNAMTEEERAQVSAFKWVSNAHAFVADIVKGNDDRLVGLPTHVNIDDVCNAFFDPNEHTLNFFKAGDGCANSAYCDVASHEFGHAVDDQFGGILDGGYSEGFGDSLAILITRDSIIGRDFQGKGTNLRDAREIHTWPPQDPEVHEVGRIYGGFTWELTQQLISKLGGEDAGFAAAKQLVLGAAALNPKDTPDAVRLSFLIDRQNGSPLFDALAAAADSRKIPRPMSPGELDDPNSLTAKNGQ